MGWATFWALFAPTHLVTLNPKQVFFSFLASNNCFDAFDKWPNHETKPGSTELIHFYGLELLVRPHDANKMGVRILNSSIHAFVTLVGDSCFLLLLSSYICTYVHT
jgi:hypothetical protein